jgi:hypothetical protein
MLVFSIMLMITFLRLNNIGMVSRRAAVVNSDTNGNDTVTKQRLIELQAYVTSHMNTDMGKGVYLEGSYKRDVQAAYKKASSDYNPNGNIYKKAQEVCAPKFTSWSQSYIQCTINELNKYPSGPDLASDVKLPDANKYLHNFVSPLWSADFAGLMVMISAAIFTMILARSTSVLLLQIMLKVRERNN